MPPGNDFEDYHEGITAAIQVVERAFQAYRSGDLASAETTLSTSVSANDNAETPAEDGAQKQNIYDLYYGDFAPTIISISIARLRGALQEIEALLELATKAPEVKEPAFNSAEDCLEYASQSLKWLLEQNEKTEIKQALSADITAEFRTLRQQAMDAFEAQIPYVKGVLNGDLNVVTLHTTAEDLNDILSKICEARYDACQAEYDRLSVTIDTAADFLNVLINDKQSGRSNYLTAMAEEFIINAVTCSRAHLIQIKQRLQDVDQMDETRRYAEEHKVPALPFEFPDFNIG